MRVSCGLALIAAVVFVQLLLPVSARAAAIQATEASAATHVAFYPPDAARLALTAPRIVSTESAVAYGRTVDSSYAELPRASGALAAYYAAGHARDSRSSAFPHVDSNRSTNEWRRDWNRREPNRWGSDHWEYDETPHGWPVHGGHWHGEGDDDQCGVGRHDCDHPPAVPIPPALWLFASGLAVLAALHHGRPRRAFGQPIARVAEGYAP